MKYAEFGTRFRRVQSCTVRYLGETVSKRFGKLFLPGDF
jgi:hypothetical protein